MKENNDLSLYQLRIATNRVYNLENNSLSALLRYLKENKTNEMLQLLLAKCQIDRSKLTFDIFKIGAPSEKFFMFNEEGKAIKQKAFFAIAFATSCIVNGFTKKFELPRLNEQKYLIEVSEHEAKVKATAEAKAENKATAEAKAKATAEAKAKVVTIDKQAQRAKKVIAQNKKLAKVA